MAFSVPDKDAWSPQTTQSRFRNLFKSSSWLTHFFYGVVAFSIFELLLGTLLKSLALSRNRGLFFTEFLTFALASLAIYFYSRTYRTEAKRHGFLQERSQVRNGVDTLRTGSDDFANLDKLSEGIRDSLSAIMFYARTNLVHEENSQKTRDLREIMERIDQVQLLVQNMTTLLTGTQLKSATAESKELQPLAGKESETNSAIRTDQSSEIFNGDIVERHPFLRKSARKVLILPITVRMIKNEKNMEFQTYTINVCEGGACIIFVDNVLSDKAVIDVQIAAHFESQARIKWVQLSRESSFRLAGIEFIESKLWMSSS
jgi:hypothetical protein